MVAPQPIQMQYNVPAGMLGQAAAAAGKTQAWQRQHAIDMQMLAQTAPSAPRVQQMGGQARDQLAQLQDAQRRRLAQQPSSQARVIRRGDSPLGQEMTQAAEQTQQADAERQGLVPLGGEPAGRGKVSGPGGFAAIGPSGQMAQDLSDPPLGGGTVSSSPEPSVTPNAQRKHQILQQFGDVPADQQQALSTLIQEENVPAEQFYRRVQQARPQAQREGLSAAEQTRFTLYDVDRQLKQAERAPGRIAEDYGFTPQDLQLRETEFLDQLLAADAKQSSAWPFMGGEQFDASRVPWSQGNIAERRKLARETPQYEMFQRAKQEVEAARTQQQNLRQARQDLIEGMVTVTNGQETFRVPMSDLPEAEAEGFRRANR